MENHLTQNLPDGAYVLYPDKLYIHNIDSVEGKKTVQRFNSSIIQTKRIVDQYITQHPEMLDDVRRAWFAYHSPHPHTYTGNYSIHFYSGECRSDICLYCGYSREDVRWRKKNPECEGFIEGTVPSVPPLANIQRGSDVNSVLHNEETVYFKLLEKMKLNMPMLWLKYNGDTLKIYQTYGYPEDMQIDWYENDGGNKQ